MRPTKSILAALAALAISATAAFAAIGPGDAADHGLDRATVSAAKVVPARPASAPAPALVAPSPADDPNDQGDRPVTHGTTVSVAAKGETPGSVDNHGAYVSSVARVNHGQEIAAEARPDTAGKPDGAGKPEGAGRPDQPGKPATPGAPGGAGRP